MEADRLLVVLAGAVQRLGRKPSLVITGLEEGFIGSRVRHVAMLRWRIPGKLNAERAGDGRGNFVLQGKDVSHDAVVALGEQMGAVVRRDELGTDAYAVAGAAHAALKDGADTERRSYRANVLFLAAKGECRGTGDHLESGDLCEKVDDLLGQAVPVSYT